MAETIKCVFPAAVRRLRRPANTMLFPSLPPDVKMMLEGVDPNMAATCSLEAAIALAAQVPMR